MVNGELEFEGGFVVSVLPPSQPRWARQLPQGMGGVCPNVGAVEPQGGREGGGAADGALTRYLSRGPSLNYETHRVKYYIARTLRVGRNLRQVHPTDTEGGSGDYSADSPYEFDACGPVPCTK